MSAVEQTEERHELIARAAYLKAEKRGFVGGDPVEDWLSAEAEVEAQLRSQEDKKERLDFRQYREQLKAQLDAATQRLEELHQRANSLRGEARREWRRDVEDIGQRRDALEKKLEELRKKGRAKRDELKHQAEHVLDELKRSLDKLYTGSRGKRQ